MSDVKPETITALNARPIVQPARNRSFKIFGSRLDWSGDRMTQWGSGSSLYSDRQIDALLSDRAKLLVALKELLDEVRFLDDEGPADSGWQSDRLKAAIAKADRAIAKAESR